MKTDEKTTNFKRNPWVIISLLCFGMVLPILESFAQVISTDVKFNKKDGVANNPHRALQLLISAGLLISIILIVALVIFSTVGAAEYVRNMLLDHYTMRTYQANIAITVIPLMWIPLSSGISLLATDPVIRSFVERFFSGNYVFEYRPILGSPRTK